MGAYGLQTHIWNNNLRSLLLLAGFPVLLLLVTYGLFLLFAGLMEVNAPFVWAAEEMTRAWPFAILGAVIWFSIAYFAHQAIIDAAVGARKVERKDAPDLYNLLENLCISRGIPMPALRVIETPAMNAFASGIEQRNYSITVTRGLIETLNKQELEAVLAHELTHIRNRDVRLLVVAVVFVGIFSFVGEIVFRGLTRARFSARRSSSNGNSKGNAGLAILVALAIIAIAYALAVVIRFSLSRRREFLADAGAVELTKNPDAMISALQKISGHSAIPQAPADVREMFIENPHMGLGDLFATHPPIEKRIAALVEFGGGKVGPWGAAA